MSERNKKPVELYRKYRPDKLEDVIGQKAAVQMLSEAVRTKKIPAALMFIGPSGVGKTTTARIFAKLIGCSMTPADIEEINVAQSRGIDKIRAVASQAALGAMGGGRRVWILDEVHSATKEAQEAMLKMLEDVPPRAHYILCTTNPDKVIKTVRGRCRTVPFVSLKKDTLRKLLTSVATKEDRKVSDSVIDAVLERADGSGREALQMLDSVLGLDDASALEALAPEGDRKTAYDLARALVWAKAPWPAVVKIFEGLAQEEHDPSFWETLRRLVLACATKELLNRGGSKNPQSEKAFLILDEFKEPVFYTGKAGLVRAAYAVVSPA